MKLKTVQRRTLVLAGVILALLATLVWVAARSGPLAPIAVTEARVESLAVQPKLFGVGSVEARFTARIGPTFAGRVGRLEVQVGDRVRAGQVVGEMDPVDLDDRIRAQQALIGRAQAALSEATARQSYADLQARRYEQLLAARSTSEELLTTKRQDLKLADAALSGAREDLARVRADHEALLAQRRNLRLVAPVDGIVTLREVEPGTTVVAGQAVLEVIDPKGLWINARIDQVSATGLAADLPARIALRSRSGEPLDGRVLRVEPKADAVTEEMLVKVVFAQVPAPLPPIGELAEVTIDLPALPEGPAIPNAAVQRQGTRLGVWRVTDDKPAFAPVRLGRADLDGRVQVLDGLSAGDRIVVYSEKALGPDSRIHVVDRIPGAPK